MKDLQCLTSNNPLLFSQACTSATLPDVEQKVFLIVRNFLSYNLKIDSNLLMFFTSSLEETDNYFQMALGGIPFEDETHFNQSWVGQHKVYYIADRKTTSIGNATKKEVIIQINFPTLPLMIKDDLNSIVKKRPLT